MRKMSWSLEGVIRSKYLVLSHVMVANILARYIAIAWKDPDGQNIVDELKEEKEKS